MQFGCCAGQQINLPERSIPVSIRSLEHGKEFPALSIPAAVCPPLQTNRQVPELEELKQK